MTDKHRAKISESMKQYWKEGRFFGIVGRKKRTYIRKRYYPNKFNPFIILDLLA